MDANQFKLLTQRSILDILDGDTVSSIGEMRNESSDSHGVGLRRIAVEERHAMLAVNSAATMAEFILAVVESVKA